MGEILCGSIELFWLSEKGDNLPVMNMLPDPFPTEDSHLTEDTVNPNFQSSTIDYHLGYQNPKNSIILAAFNCV